MADSNTISADEVRALFSYDPETGKVTRLVTTGNRSIAGADVGSADLHGYRTTRIGRRSYKLHRIIWLHVYGSWPKGDVDHINGNRSDNRISNLRDVPRGTNLQNQREAPNNKSTGVLGVYRDGARFYSRISINNKSKHLGTFDTVEQARQAYLSAKRAMHEGCTI